MLFYQLQGQSFKLIIYKINNNRLTVMSNQTVRLIASTLNPSLLQSSQQQIQSARKRPNFSAQLLMIADNNQIDIQIRQSALIILKNMLYDQFNIGNILNEADYINLKASILDAMTRQWGNKYLTPTYRQIIHLIAQIDYPDRWPEIVPVIVENIISSSDFNCVSSSVEGLKAIISVCGRSLSQEITINNLANKILIPLFELANKLFSNYNQLNQPILISIFKIFNLAIFYHLPTIFINNIHSLMIFCKKIIDLNLPEMTVLRLTCLKILSRIYSRHVGGKVPYKLIKFAEQFHQKYSIPMIQSFIMQLMTNQNPSQIINLSLHCLTSIYKNDENSVQVINKYYDKLLQICIQRFRMRKIRENQSVGSYITHLKQQRNNFIQFFLSVFRVNQDILAHLIEILNQSNEEVQQVVLYIFGAIGNELEEYSDLHKSMAQFLIEYILPVLSGRNSYVMKARGCEVISAYSYIDLPSQNLQSIFQFIYSCLTEQKDEYLNIYALQAFTKLICKYDSFMNVIVPYLPQILKVYINLLKLSNGEVYEVIKSLELFISHLNGNDIATCAVDLIKFLADLFYEYVQQHKNNAQSNLNNSSDDEEDQDDEDQNPYNARSGCLASIRQIIATQNLPKELYPQIINECLLSLCSSLLVDNQLLHFQQCLNILNLCLFKSDQLLPNFDQFFKIFIYGIIGIPNQLKSVNLGKDYQNILENICANPDEDLVSNVVGYFRNFISKARNRLRDYKDEIGVSFLEYLFKIVEHVQLSKQQNIYQYKKSDRMLILTIYTSLLQYQFLRADQFQLIVNNVMIWFSNSVQPPNFNNVYIEMLLICLYYGPEITVKKLNIQWFIQKLLERFGLFKEQYQLQRLILGVSVILENQMLSQNIAQSLIKILPEAVYRLGSQRHKDQQDLPQEKQQIDIEEEAEQDLIAENTHLGLMPMNAQQRQKQLQNEIRLNNYDELEWDQQYNKFYYSPFLNINELDYLTNTLKNSSYTSLLSMDQQQKLTQLIVNAPAKNMKI